MAAERPAGFCVRKRFMKYQFFAIPADLPDAAQRELNNFCSNHKVGTIEKYFVHNGNDSFWAICVTYIDGADAKPKYPKSKIDYREVLNEKDFAVYAKLRTLRKIMSEKEGVPAYALFNNEQLANMVRGRVVTVKDLGAIFGKVIIGDFQN